MSDFIEIDRKPVIFDDPEYCHNKSERCKFLYISTNNQFARCDQFEKRQNYNFDKELFEKCDECKTAWKKAKEKDKPVKNYPPPGTTHFYR